MPLWLARNSRQTKINEDGTVVWNQVPGSFNNYGVAVNAAEKSVFVHAVSSSVTHRARDTDGNSLWYGNHGVVLYAVAFDPSGNVYIAGDDTAGGTHYRKLDGDGNIIYSIDGSDICAALSARGATYMYVGVGNYVYQRNGTSTSWVPNWSYNHGAAINALTEDSSGNIYMGGGRASNRTVRKLNTSGSVVWSFDTGGTVYGLALDESETNLYVVGARVSSKTAWKLNASTGAEITAGWPKDHGGTLRAVAVDTDGYVYVGGVAVSTVTLRKYQSDGTEVTDGDWPSVLAGTCYGIAYLKLAQTGVDGLPFPLRLGLPTVTYSHAPGGLSLPLSLALPMGSVPPIPGAPSDTQPTRYRLYLSAVGGDDLLELRMAAVECRRRVNASTWLTVTVPATSTAMINEIQARWGGAVVIYAGSGQFLRATVTDIAIDQGSRAISVAITARVIPTAFSAGSYALTGVSERGADDGRRTVRCAVDERIRPNDTVDDGLASWTAGIIRYRISPSSSGMHITEAL